MDAGGAVTRSSIGPAHAVDILGAVNRRLACGRAVACAGVAALAISISGAGNAVAASPKHGHTIFQSRHLWATIDVCGPRSHTHVVGVRGSMPGSGLANESMYMRFALQYRNAAGVWVDVGAGADSGFLAVGPSTFKARQSGRNFVLDVQAGSHYVVRGVVTFEWRRRGHVVRNARKATTAGHQAIAGADPPGYSAAACELS